jgi:intracellular multiplication protein IcmT
MSFTNISWRDTGLTMRFGPVDARVLALVMVWLYHMRLWTLGIGVVGVTFLAVVEYKGYTIPNALRRLSVFIMGRHRPAVSSRRLGRTDR